MSERVRIVTFIVGGLAVVVSLAFFLAPQASSKPDALSEIAAEQGLADAEIPHALGDSPTAGYGVRGVDNDALSTALAGVLGVGVTFVVGAGAMLALRRLRTTG